MSYKKRGRQTVVFENPPTILTSASVVGLKEHNGPLGDCFDMFIDDPEQKWGEDSWEKTETKMVKETFKCLLRKTELTEKDIEYFIAGDLLNQCIATGFASRDIDVPHLGIYGACSSFGEGSGLGAMLVEGGFAKKVSVVTSSHFCTAERQYRYPLELGAQRTPTSQWTATAAGGLIISADGNGPKITAVSTGKIVDKGIKDVNNMGAAMAPAAVDTIRGHFLDTGLDTNYYDLVVTGDLGVYGRRICSDMLKEYNIDLKDKLVDSGTLLYDLNDKKTSNGASGCGCVASVFSGHFFAEMLSGRYKKILLVATGALHSPTSAFQKESIPVIANAVAIENMEG